MTLETILSYLQIVEPYLPTIISIIALIIAWWSAHEARVANKKAEESNTLAKEANTISQQAFELQQRQSPPPWSEITKEGKYFNLIENLSGKDAIITQIQAFPEDASKLMSANDLPKFVAYGDKYKFSIIRTFGTNIESIKIKWHYKNEPENEYEIIRNIN
ncbi:MAG: hypothetical protein GX914_01195 [Erysipelotrichia bacterium]|jgi:hypothetical protein|nr:hypothetical protein [Erysipelotrichia bacterium]